MTHTPLSVHRTRLDYTAHLVTIAAAKLPQAWRNLNAAQPGYPTGGDSATSSGTHSDRTGDLAADAADGHVDPARATLDALDTHLGAIWAHARDAARIIAAWADPPPDWRKALATEAAKDHVDTWCRLHLAVGSHAPRRPEGGDLCRWCADAKRAIGRAGDLPSWLVELHAQGKRVSQTDIERARSQMRKAK